MSARLTRETLYQLVWSRPRTALAREMGVSDVWIGKQCRALNVPAPPPGYWAHRAAGQPARAKYARPPLAWTVGERLQADHEQGLAALRDFDPRRLDLAMPAMPEPDESPEQAAARYAGLARAAPRRRRGGGHHPVVLRLLEEDERRAGRADRFSFHQPLYRGTDGPALLRLLDDLAWHWQDCGFKVTASRSRDVVLRVGCGQRVSRFEVISSREEARRRDRAPGPATFEVWFDREPSPYGTRRAPAPSLVFAKGDTKAVDAVTDLLLTRWEQEYRYLQRSSYEWAVQRRQQAVRDAEEAARIERERREEQVRALLRQRHRLLVRAVDGIHRADTIRSLVQAVGGSLASHTDDAVKRTRWTAWALAQADRMDLRTWTAPELARWLDGFELERDSGPGGPASEATQEGPPSTT